MSDSLILTKAKAFAIRVVKLHKYLRGKREATMSKQILRCGTSIGANLAEAKYAQSKDDFISKQSIALKEAGETLYWLELLRDVDLIPGRLLYPVEMSRQFFCQKSSVVLPSPIVSARMRGKEVGMNKKLIIMLGVATVMVGGAFAYPHHGWHGGPRHCWGPRPYYHHHHYHGGYWGPGGRYFWPGFVGGVIGGAVASTIIDTSPTVVVQQPAVVQQPVVVQQPAPVVVQQPAPVVVQQPQQVWVEGRYVDQVQANGSTVRIWQPGHYEQR